MEFRLTYDGSMRSGGGGGSAGKVVSAKHAIRKAFHQQLKRLWEVVPDLKIRSGEHSILSAPSETSNPRTITSAAASRRESIWETLGQLHNKCNLRFVPLVSNHLQLSCGLDILLLQRERIAPLGYGGDIDNRLKTLFDAMQVPENCEGIDATNKSEDEEPYFFCLLENDNLITDVRVNTDRLLTPFNIPAGTVGAKHPENFVHLVITVKVRPTVFSFDNLSFVT